MKHSTEFFAGIPVAYWKVVNRTGKVIGTFDTREHAEDIVISSGCSYLYNVLPVYKENERSSKWK